MARIALPILSTISALLSSHSFILFPTTAGLVLLTPLRLMRSSSSLTARSNLAYSWRKRSSLASSISRAIFSFSQCSNLLAVFYISALSMKRSPVESIRWRTRFEGRILLMSTFFLILASRSLFAFARASSTSLNPGSRLRSSSLISSSIRRCTSEFYGCTVNFRVSHSGSGCVFASG